MLKIGAQEKKLFVIFVYILLLGAVALTSFTINTRNAQETTQRIFEYFLCEENGVNSRCDTERNSLENEKHPWLSAFSYVLIGLFPVIFLMYFVNKELYNSIRERLMCN